MQTVFEIQTLINHDMNQTGTVQTALQTAYDELKKALISNLKTLANPELSEIIIQERIHSIFSILSGPVTNLPALSKDNVNNFRNKLKSLVELHNSIQPYFLSKIAKTGLFLIHENKSRRC